MASVLKYGNFGLKFLTGTGFVRLGDIAAEPSLPPYTIRLKFTNGVTPTFSKGTGVQVSSSPNIWDLTYQNTNWEELLDSQTDLIEVLGANTTGITNMEGLFEFCTQLTTVALFDTSTSLRTGRMFLGCSLLTDPPLFDTSNAYAMQSMFNGCTSLTAVPLYNTTNCQQIQAMFRDCPNVQSGALALYQQATGQSVPPQTYFNCFTNCGSNTVTGAAELAQIPVGWGGTMS